MSQSSIHGPAINQRTVTLSERIDPLGLGRYENWFTERVVYDEYLFRSSYEIRMSGKLLAESTTEHDWGKFGDSIPLVIERAGREYRELKTADVEVFAELHVRPFILSDSSPFYINTVYGHYLIPRWGYYRDGPSTTKQLCDVDPKIAKFRLWKNGEYTDQWEIAKGAIDTIPVMDQLADYRRKN